MFLFVVFLPSVWYNLVECWKICFYSAKNVFKYTKGRFSEYVSMIS